MSKNDAINMILSWAKKLKHYKPFSLCMKMSEATYYQRNREAISNRAKDYYKNNKESLREKAKNKYSELSEEDKNIKKWYGRNRYKNMPEEKILRLKKYQKNYREARKSYWFLVKQYIINFSFFMDLIVYAFNYTLLDL